LLEELGWKWDAKKEMFDFLSQKEKRVGRDVYKYYLTKAEYSDRISIKKS